MPARLPIDNPLDAVRFTAEMAGKAAILTTGDTARAVLFSAHPEMGDVLRKYVALDTYVAHYLPIRGPAVMEQTLDYYESNDTPSFRLILNAIDHLLPTGTADKANAASTPAPPVASSQSDINAAGAANITDSVDASAWHTARGRLLESAGHALGALSPAADPFGRLLNREIAGLHELAATLTNVNAPALGGAGALRMVLDAAAVLEASVARLRQTPASTQTTPDPKADARSMAQDLLSIELPLRILEAFARINRIASS
jgi:hypothetical protein